MINSLKILLYLSLFCISQLSIAKEIHAGKGYAHKTIKEAVTAASNGDIVIVHPGIYKENNIVINKSISLKGTGKPVLDAGHKDGSLVIVESNNVHISGLTLRNVPSDYVSDNSAIKILRGHNCSVSGNTFEKCFFGVYLSDCSDILISGNHIKGELKTETSSGNGIHLWKCRNININGNNISNHRDGIYFEFVKNSFVEKNECTKNLRYGLHFMYSDSCSYINNNFTDNGAGVAVMYTKSILMKSNHFSRNWGPTSYGILLKEISKSTITGNTFENNTSGIHAEGASKILIKNNSFTGNGWAFRMLGNCSDNTVTNNNFISNTFDVATNSMNNHNHFSRNYWSKYKGYDINKDKIGDIPYYPVSLFSKTIETAEESIILMNSFFIDILETTEKYIPSVIPKKVRDEKPMMEAINVKF